MMLVMMMRNFLTSLELEALVQQSFEHPQPCGGCCEQPALQVNFVLGTGTGKLCFGAGRQED
jgi:hypothetical protein